MSKRQTIVGLIVITMLALSMSTTLAATRTVTLRVEGMTCGGCATSVEKALKATDGVMDVRVSFERGRAVIKYNDQKVTVEKLREVIQSTGFFCEVETKKS